jgi:phosphate transport system substrate-binding protein
MRLFLIGMMVIVGMISGCSGKEEEVQIPTEKPLVGNLTFAGSTTLQPLAAELGEGFQEENPQVTLDIAAGGSTVGIQAVHDGTVDIGMASRSLSDEEAQDIEVHQVASDVISIVVHPDNPVSSITLEELAAVYRGEITNWSELGGNDREIVPVIREETSGTRGAFDKLVLDKEAPQGENLTTAVTAGDVSAIVAENRAAIGYTSFGYLDDTTKVLGVNDVLPSFESVLDGSYLLTRPLLLMTGSLSQPLADEFIDFALSPAGQEMVEELGWVPAK